MLNLTTEKLFWLPAVIIAAGIFVSLQLERLARPKCPGAKRPWAAILLHSGLLLTCLAPLLAITGRVTFALLLLLAGQFLVIQVNNAKYRALREPFLFSDFGIFSQTIKHPRLYLPFLGLGRALLAAACGLAAIGFGWSIEIPNPHSLGWAAGSACLGTILLAGGWALAASPTLDPQHDMARHGLFASIAQYWLREKTVRPTRQTHLPVINKSVADLPDIIVIQSESFFDPRRMFPGIRREILANYDKACTEAAMHGRLQVPAWGANTMRPEFCFLSGLAPDSLDVHRFNPYRRVARRPLRALPAALRESGYRTTCLHPHPARFFRRDRAFPFLGFERFIDDRTFQEAKRCGPYISDEAVTDKLLEELGNNTCPSFFFVITMENHGPLHLEKVEAEDIERFYHEAPPAGCEDLTIYLRHLQNADWQLGRLLEHLASRSRPAVLCFYGEHLPSMPRVYDALGMPDGRTDYFLMGIPAVTPQRADLRVEDLPSLILRGL